MGRERKQAEPEDAQGAPEWMVTFSDCMTLLLTFFVLLLSFSSFDENIMEKLKIIFCKALPSVSPARRKYRDAFLSPPEQIVATEDLDEGSEKPTLARGREENLKEDTEPADFSRRKVFLISSNRIFWGRGAAISFQGRKTLSTIASFLKEVPNRIVISENGPGDDQRSEQFALPRAWAVMEHLTTGHGLDKKRFSISATSTIIQESFEKGEPDRPGPETERMLEIVLLERSIYN
jgi:chemotaxis protein MotB